VLRFCVVDAWLDFSCNSEDSRVGFCGINTCARGLSVGADCSYSIGAWLDLLTFAKSSLNFPLNS
jgi:hypothetical protein